MANTNVRDPNPETSLEVFKVDIDDKSIGKILSKHQNLTLNEAYYITLGIAESNEIKDAQVNWGE